MQIGLALFLVIDALDGFVRCRWFDPSTRCPSFAKAAKFTDPHPGKQCNENASGLPIQVHVDALNKVAPDLWIAIPLS